MVLTNLTTRGFPAIAPGPLLGSTLAIVLLWTLRHNRQRRLTWTSTPLPPRGYQLLPSASTAQVPVRVGMTADQPSEGSPAFYDWVFSMTTRFHCKPWILHRVGRPDVLVVSSPGAFEDIQRTFAAQFEKVDGDVEGLTHDVHGGAIAMVCSSQLRPSVSLQRQLAASVLSSPAVRQQAKMLVKRHLSSLLKALEDKLDVKLIRHFALEVFAELGFGLQCRVNVLEDAIDDIQSRVAERLQRPAVSWKLERLLDVGSEAALSRSVNVVNSVALEVVEAKRKKHRDSGYDGVGMLDLLLAQKSSSKSVKDPDFLAEFVLRLVVAARDSMAHTLTACLQCLAQNPEEQEKLLQELTKAEQEGKDERSIIRLEAVVKEALRLHPGKPFIRRRARQDTVLSDGTFVAEGTEVAMDLYSLARRENVWGSESAQFRPQRWIDTDTGKMRPVSNYKFNVFLGGPKACLGADLALTGLKTVIAAVVTKVHLDVTTVNDGKDKTVHDEVLRIQTRRRDNSRPGHYS